MSVIETTTGEVAAQAETPGHAQARAQAAGHGHAHTKEAAPASRRQRRTGSDELPLAAYPVARLLPPEVLASGRVRTTRNLMCYLVALVLLLTIAATYFAHVYAQHEQQHLTALEGQTGAVLAQEGKYASVRTDQAELKLGAAAEHVGAGGSIDWQPYFAQVEARLPAGTVVDDISGQTASPIAAVDQDTGALAKSRAAIVTVTVTEPSSTAIANTADAFRSLPGFSTASIGPITETGGGAGAPAGWSAVITVSLTPAASSSTAGN